MGNNKLSIFAWLVLIITLSGCSNTIPEGSLIVIQTPIQITDANSATNTLDNLYPAGSRLVLLEKPFENGKIKVISKGFYSAGSPYIAWDGMTIYFVGKKNKESEWQIYKVAADGSHPEKLTEMTGGACSPCLIADGSLAFISPVPLLKAGSDANVTAVYLRLTSGEIKKISYSPKPIYDLTVLNDGRILFVSDVCFEKDGNRGGRALYVMNNDGTEISRFAIDNDGAPFVRKPRQIANDKIVFLASLKENPMDFCWGESVSLARPFLSRTQFFAFANMHCSSIQGASDGSVFACFMNYGSNGRTMKGSFGIYKISEGQASPGISLYDDLQWNEIEALPLEPRTKPKGRMSSIIPGKKTGNILCMDANYHRSNADNPKAAKVRVLTLGKNGKIEVLGWSEVEQDGSFMLEVPSDQPLGFETCDSRGNAIYRVEPLIWLRPGENRSCLGCHEPYNRAPKNFRPLAINSGPKPLKQEPMVKKN